MKDAVDRLAYADSVQGPGDEALPKLDPDYPEYGLAVDHQFFST